LIRQLKTDSKTSWDIHYIGRKSNSNDIDNQSIESIIIPKNGIKFYPISCGKLDRRYIPNTIIGIPKTILGFFQAHRIIKKIKPNIVVSFGGYVSVPVVFNSWLKNISSITHEQTPTNSLTTKINSKFVDKIALSFDNQKQINQLDKNKVRITGNLLRYELFDKTIKPKFKISTKKPIIYITAGNQGSHFINLLIKKIIPILSNFQIIHQTGKGDFVNFKRLESKYPNYLSFDYLDTKDASWILNHSQIIISRSGANTCQEIVALNQKSILIPLLVSQQDEQILNANWVKSKLPNSTIVILQNEVTQNKILKAIEFLANSKRNNQNQAVKTNLKLLQLIHEVI